MTLPKGKVRNVLADHHMVADDGVMAIVVVQAEDMAEDAAEVAIAVIAEAQAVAATRKATARLPG